MKEIRNPDNRLVCCFDEKTRTIERLEKRWITKIKLPPNCEIKFTHHKKAANS